jgi:hypothetical protein
MKQFLKFLISLMLFLFVMSPVTTALSRKAEISQASAAIAICVVAVVLTLISKPKAAGVYTAGVAKEMWVDYIIKRFWKDNAFLKYVYSDDQYVYGGAVVHVPQQGTKPVVVKNRASFPAVAVRRTDTDIFYGLDTYTTDPSHVTNAESIDVSYNKMDDIYGDHMAAISEAVSDDMLYKYLFGAQVRHTAGLLTTGGSAQTTAATANATATGNRILTTHRDVRAINLLMNTQNVPKAERYALVDENMADQIFESLSDNQSRQFTEYADATTGILGKLYNFNIMTRSSVATADNSDVIKAIGAAGATTDSAVSLFWEKNSIARALGTVKVYDDTDNPLYYGDIMSMELRAGGRRRRADNLGVIALVQGASS